MLEYTETPQNQEFHLEGIRNVHVLDAFMALQNEEAILVDVRETHETSQEYIPLPGVVYHPMSEILDQLSQIPVGKPLIVACPGGVRSTKVANLLQVQGFQQVYNLDGGLNFWKAQGFPMQQNASGHCGCGCGGH